MFYTFGQNGGNFSEFLQVVFRKNIIRRYAIHTPW